jgi:hypothetical protein
MNGAMQTITSTNHLSHRHDCVAPRVSRLLLPSLDLISAPADSSLGLTLDPCQHGPPTADLFLYLRF